MSEITGHNARLAHCDEFVIRRTEDRTLRNPQNEIEGIERATAQLKLQAEAFQQDLLSRLRDPNVKGRQQVASMLCSRLESEARLCGEKEKLLTECRELCGGLDGLERNIAIDQSPALFCKLPQLRNSVMKAAAPLNMSAWRAAAGRRMGDDERPPEFDTDVEHRVVRPTCSAVGKAVVEALYNDVGGDPHGCRGKFPE